MKKQVLSFFAITAIGMSYSLFNNQSNLYSNAGGAPSAGDCTSCHSGGAAQTSDNILLTILDGTTPVTSYVAGKTYNVGITVNPSFTNAKFGFALQASAGTLIAGSNMQLSGTFLTHTAGGTLATPTLGGKLWAGQWTAPTSGNVLMQLFVNATNNNNQNTGDVIYKKSVNIGLATGVNDVFNEKTLTVYPNPIADVLNIDLEMEKAGQVEVNILGIDGKLIKSEGNHWYAAGMQHITVANQLPAGLYMVQLSTNNHTVTKRVLVK